MVAYGLCSKLIQITLIFKHKQPQFLYDKIEQSNQNLNIENKNRVGFCSDGTNSVASNENGLAGKVIKINF